MLMKFMPITRAALAGVLVVLSMLLTGCVTTVGTKAYYHHPAHVWYDYYYYPTLDIYLEIDSGYYWHRSHDHWVRVKHLPTRFHTHGHKRVFLRLDVDKPYRHHKAPHKRYHPLQHKHSDARKGIPHYASDLHRDTHQAKRHNQRRTEDNAHVGRRKQVRPDNVRKVITRRADTPNTQKRVQRRLDNKSQGIRPKLKQRGTVRDDIPEHNNRSVDARLKQKPIQQRSKDKHLRGNSPRQFRRNEIREETSKPVLEGRKDRNRSQKGNRNRSDHKASVNMKNSGRLPAHTEQQQ
ncbi:MAG: hypothetical protein HKP55_10700 [Gammaproteobacteria bacterium]|nr:hypothetical protein [Gammaproteobacteria bacterium]